MAHDFEIRFSSAIAADCPECGCQLTARNLAAGWVTCPLCGWQGRRSEGEQ